MQKIETDMSEEWWVFKTRSKLNRKLRLSGFSRLERQVESAKSIGMNNWIVANPEHLGGSPRVRARAFPWSLRFSNSSEFGILQ